ncbi:hypothetical protein OC845_006310 [Tilletia horrida]|nr:hypothetical protein OC845_006310 [Tilletia horrida]
MGASQAKANIQAAERLCQQLERAGLGHFARVRQLATHFICEDAVGPCVQPSQVFVAFDLLRSGDITTKVYFMPHVRAATTNKTALRIIEDAIRATEGQQHAWRLICDYLQDRSRLTREPDPVILSTDCVDTSKARLKIYFRFRTSRKQDMISAMSLGGRIGFDWEGPIRQVCDAVLGREQEDIDPLKTCEDLTGGFQNGSVPRIAQSSTIRKCEGCN